MKLGQSFLFLSLLLSPHILLADPATPQYSVKVTRLNPAGSNASQVFGIEATTQAGYASFGAREHAGFWKGTAASWVDLHPPGAYRSLAYAAGGSQQAGLVSLAGVEHASLWTGSAASWVDLHPATMASSSVRDTDGLQQVGTATTPNGIREASLWSGTAQSWVNLHPPLFDELSLFELLDAPSLVAKLKTPADPVSAFVQSRLRATTRAELESWQTPAIPTEKLKVLLIEDLNGIMSGELIWNETVFQGVLLRPETQSFVDQNPSGLPDWFGEETEAHLNRLLLEDAYPVELSRERRLSEGDAWFSAAHAVARGQQAGSVGFGSGAHPVVWSGSAVSWVDLLPSRLAGWKILGGEIFATTGTQQAGYVLREVDGENPERIACRWEGTPQSSVSLHPAGATESGVYGMTEDVQAGYATLGGLSHAGIWMGSSGSWLDLHPYLTLTDPQEASVAWGVWSDGSTIQVIGMGHRATGPVLWELTPLSTPVNQKPTLSQTGNRLLYRGQSLTVALLAFDPDGPGSGLNFALTEAAPGMVLDSVTGIITWTPGPAVPSGTYRITASVTDDGTPPLSDTASFQVTFREPRFQVTTVILNQEGAVYSGARTTTADFQAGHAGNQACLWTGTAESLVILGSPGTMGSSVVNGSSGNHQAGSAWISGTHHAGFWSGTRDSWVDLHPARASSSFAMATDGSRQGGTVDSHAALWYGTAASWIDLHPKGALGSGVLSMVTGQLAGSATFPDPAAPNNPATAHVRAGIWTDSADSWIDLHPAGAGSSEVSDTSGSQQVGRAGERAMLWSGTADSARSLHPEGARFSTALGTIDAFQCGWVTSSSGEGHAGVWTGTADSWFDLHGYVGRSATGSVARDLAFSGNNILVVGSYQPTGDTGPLAVLWILTPVLDPLVPGLTVPSEATIAEGTTWSGQLQASPSFPGQVLRLSLISGPPGLSLDPITGAMSWLSTESSGPGTHVVTVRVADDSTPPNVTVRTFRIHVTEVNSPPEVTVPPDLSLVQGNSIVITNITATDSDLPRSSLRFSLVAPPQGMTINPTNGWIAWQSTSSHPAGLHTINVQVSDQGNPALSVTRSFTIDLKPTGYSVRVVFLDPADSTESTAYAVTEGRQAGFAGPRNGEQSASLWEGSRTSRINLSPAGSARSEVLDMEGNQQVGYANRHAGLWSGTAESWVDLHPPGALYSGANSISGNRQGGYVEGHAALWSGSPTSWVDLNPPGASGSTIADMAGDQQVGSVWLTGQGSRAALWHGSPGSWVDLTPPSARSAEIKGTTGAQQAGYVYLPYAPNQSAGHASVWSGTPDSWRDLHPEGAIESFLKGTIGSHQVGYAQLRDPGAVQTNSRHALLWNDTRDSWMDLHPFLGQSFDITSEANALWSDGARIHIVGTIRTFSRSRAVLWILTPLDSAVLRLTGPGDTVVPEGVPVVLQATISSIHPAGNLRYSLISAPQGMVIHAATGVISWTPTEAQGPAIHQVTMKVVDDSFVPLSDTRTFSLTVAEVNRGPTLGTIPDMEIAPGESLNFQASASDPDLPANALAYALTRFPPGMTINAVSGRIAWTPQGNGSLGDWEVLVEVNDQGTPPLTDLRSFRIRVHHRSPPVAYPDTIQRKPGQGIKVRVTALLANDVDPDQQALTIVALQPVTLMGGKALLESGWVFYQPPAGFDPPTDSFVYTIRDASGYEAEATVTISLVAAGTEPTLNILGVSGGYPNPAILRFAGIPRRTYVVQSSPSFNPPVWRTLGSIVVPANGIAEFHDPEAATQPVLFYRTMAP